MIPSKEAKLLTYQLMENNLICLQELKKTINASTPSKALYLFYVNFDQASTGKKNQDDLVYKNLTDLLYLFKKNLSIVWRYIDKLAVASLVSI